MTDKICGVFDVSLDCVYVSHICKLFLSLFCNLGKSVCQGWNTISSVQIVWFYLRTQNRIIVYCIVPYLLVYITTES